MLEQDGQAGERTAYGEQRMTIQAALNTCQKQQHKGRKCSGYLAFKGWG